MKLVVDANILLAAIISKSTTRNLLFDSRFDLCGPDTLVEEVLRHIETDSDILKKSKLTSLELGEIFKALLSGIAIIPFESYAKNLDAAIEIAPHKEDAPYLAVAMFLNCPIWTSDGGIAKQKLVRVVTTKELVSLLQ